MNYADSFSLLCLCIAGISLLMLLLYFVNDLNGDSFFTFSNEISLFLITFLWFGVLGLFGMYGDELSNRLRDSRHLLTFLTIMCVVNGGRYGLRLKQQYTLSYGLFEILIVAVGVISWFSIDLEIYRGLSQFTGTLFLAIRGLENVEKGIENNKPSFYPYWKVIKDF